MGHTKDIKTGIGRRLLCQPYRPVLVSFYSPLVWFRCLEWGHAVCDLRPSHHRWNNGNHCIPQKFQLTRSEGKRQTKVLDHNQNRVYVLAPDKYVYFESVAATPEVSMPRFIRFHIFCHPKLHQQL